MDIPFLKFPRNEIIEVIPAAYQNEAKRIHVPGVEGRQLLGPPGAGGRTGGSTPDDVRIPGYGSAAGSAPGSVGPLAVSGGVGIASGPSSSGALSPMPGSGLASPAEPVERPPEKVINKAAEMVADKVADED